MKRTSMVVTASAILAACDGNVPGTTETAPNVPATAEIEQAPTITSISEPEYSLWDPKTDPLSEYESVIEYNNYYEFTTDKSRVAELAKNFQTSPWSVEVSGMVQNPKTYDVDDLKTKFDQEERIYRLRCVEAWSMVIPWQGFPLAKILDEVVPTSDAKYVKFTTLLDEAQMPGVRYPYPWPYVEGLRIDEAMHDLTIMATGLYGKDLLPQNGSPLRLVVPWKYGFKSIKSIVKIELVDEMPTSLWMALAPNEYGFYANVNPDVSHPRWSQATERRIGEIGRRDTLLFNGYTEEVAYLYDGMDLRKWY
ncbi:MAG: protein-methionine-sulfoxide reductase catalytic subunit MsrP [Anaerolineaceae bacterium]|nr:protein-methionine-sulfoxide reductase catalytic subunit MsrP [Anaerolineaceae bacterium]